MFETRKRSWRCHRDMGIQKRSSETTRTTPSSVFIALSSVTTAVSLDILVTLVATICCLSVIASLPSAEASSAAGTETLVGIVGRDFVLLGADSSVSQSIALTASNLDKIAHLADPFPESGGAEEGDSGDFSTSPQLQRWKENRKRQQAILAAAAGDAADSDRLLGYLKAIGSLEEYTHGGMGCDVVSVSLDGDTAFEPPSARSCGGLDARSMAHLARRCIWEKLRSRTPYRVCLLVAGMELDESLDETERIVVGEDDHSATTKPAFLSQRVQNQVKQASRSVGDSSGAGTKATTAKRNDNNVYKPSLFWLDEYGSLQAIEYGAHGHASNFLLSILDQNYRPDLTRTEALELMKECFRELRSRYVINSPEDPCIKCVDAHGVKVM